MMTSKSDRDSQKGMLSGVTGMGGGLTGESEVTSSTISYPSLWLFLTASSIFLGWCPGLVKGRRQQSQLTNVGKCPLGKDKKHLTITYPYCPPNPYRTTHKGWGVHTMHTKTHLETL